MLLSAVFALALATQQPATTAPTKEPTTASETPLSTTMVDMTELAWRQRISIEPVLQLSARSAASRVETSMTTWLGLRVGTIFNDGAGLFVGGDAALLLGVESAGTAEVEVTRTPMMVDARALVGWRAQRGFVGLAGYGYGGAGIGGGEATTHVFDDEVSRGFLTAGVKGGVGLETTLGIGLVRLETGVGVRDAHFELHGTIAAGFRF